MVASLANFPRYKQKRGRLIREQVQWRRDWSASKYGRRDWSFFDAGLKGLGRV